MGFNDVDAALRHFVLGEPVPALVPATSGIALRYWNEIYVPSEAFGEINRERELSDPLAYDVRIEPWEPGALTSTAPDHATAAGTTGGRPPLRT